MRTVWGESVKGAVLPFLYGVSGLWRDRYLCPVCRYCGPMKTKVVSSSPRLVRRHSKCPRCASVERHRLQSLVLDELFADEDGAFGAALHVAPEWCLQKRMRDKYTTYHTMDLYRKDVDYNEDIQRMGFDDGSYDMIFESRVLTIPPDYHAALREIRRVLRPGGVAIISEHLCGGATRPDDNSRTGGKRAFGLDFLDDLREVFDRVVVKTSDDFPAQHQLVNLFEREGEPYYDVPESIRVEGRGVKEVLALCYVDASSS